jgi:hypothetical protein
METVTGLVVGVLGSADTSNDVPSLAVKVMLQLAAFIETNMVAASGEKQRKSEVLPVQRLPR